MTEFQPDKGTNGNFMKLRFMFGSTGGETAAYIRDCKYFDGCSAPMCPRDSEMAKTVWFADEPVCRLNDVPGWVKRQRKIAKTCADTAGYFTLPMLERRCVVGKKISGIDPDGTETEREEAEKSWLEKHPPVKPRSGEDREKLAARLRFLRGNPS